MPDPQLKLPVQDRPGVSSGFRLRRLEMLNWGTFHEKVAILAPEGRWTLLVGENGSGKSTAVDALRTLLVPPRALNYNDASGEQRRRDRTRRSYVRGTYATTSDEESAVAIPKNLREPGEYSILLAAFANERTGETVSLVQLLWELNEKVDEQYGVARADRSIKEHLSTLGQSRELKKTLRSRGFEPFDTFSAYSERFRSLMGIANEAALAVFNQAIGVKEVLDINQFVRQHMLEGSDVLKFMNDHLRPHYEELARCSQAIEKAQTQMDALAPIAECHGRIEEADTERKSLESLLAAAPLYYAYHHLELCERESKALQLQLGDAARQRAGLEEVGRREEADRDAKIEEIAADSTQQSIHRLEVQMGEVKALLRERQRTLDDFLTHLRTLKRSPLVETEEQFLRAREEVEQQNGLLAGNRAAAHEKQTRFLVERERAQEEREMLGTELRTLRDKRVLIPSQFVAVRESLSLSTHIPIEELPFAGELLEVKHEFRAWTGAIERLVHSFGISLLVPEKHYLPVANFINSTHLKGLRFTFHRVSAEACILRTGIAFDVARVSGRLNFKEDHALAPWVKREVTRHFTHVCCPDVERLREVDYGITREGLIRDGASRHVKDDRRAVNDATNFVLGWSVEGKIKALTAAFQSAEKKVTTAEDKASEVGQQVRVLDAQISAVAGLLRVKEFSEIDVKSEQTVLSRLNQEKQELEASSERLKVLRDQLTAAKERVEANRRELDDVLKNIGALESALARLKDTLGVLTEKVQSDATFDPQSYEASFAPLQEAGGLTLANVATLEGQVCRTLRGQIEKREKLATAARNKMLPLMSEFLRDYPEHTAHLRAEAAYAGDFTALRKRIDLEQLRPQQERFDKFVGESLIGDMAMFHCKMLEHEKGLRNRVELVNSALCKVPFTETTHIQIVVRSVRGNEIPQFRAELKECLSGGLNPTAEDRVRIFARIRELMTKFEKDEAWAHRVTDARNWLEFNLRELANADSREVNFYSASSGKSGGQKAKLAFTVLASAIAAQYGLLGTDSNPDAFRLVVIDEAFARTDEANSQRALELFNALGLQLIVVNPFDAKGRIVEEYVESFHLAVNPNGNSSKLRRASRIEYEAARSGADRN